MRLKNQSWRLMRGTKNLQLQGRNIRDYLTMTLVHAAAREKPPPSLLALSLTCPIWSPRGVRPFLLGLVWPAKNL